MDIRLVAKTYIDNGWAVVPLNAGEKRASVRWQNTTYKPSDFLDDSNIAVKLGDPSNGLVDVDCDHPFAVTAAKQLLPATGRVFGRSSKPSSHYLFLCPGIKTTQFTDVKQADGSTQMLVEIRSTAGYTMFPPSRHPSGDDVAWEIERDVMQRTPEEMFSDARAVALAALLAIHYPGHGAKHFAVGQYLPGFLLQAKVPEILVKYIIRTAASLAGDTDWADREKAINATIAKFKNGEPVAGGPKLADAVGAEVVQKMRAWLKMADMDALEEMNSRHFFVTLGSKSVIGREDKPEGVVFQPVRELYPEYANRMVQVGTDKDGNASFQPLFETWLKSPSRRSFSRIVFNPPPLEASDTEYNLWKGFAITPQEGDCSKFRDHLLNIVCSGNVQHFEYLEKFCAFCVQQPGIPAGVAVVMRGRQGTGKGTVLQMFRKIFGKHHFTQLDRSEELVKWNALVSGKVVVFADEAFFAGDKENIGALKRIITEPTIRIARKHLDSTEEANCIHLFMATNEEWAIPAGMGERRFFALEVSDAKEQDEAYFAGIYDEMANGGDAAFLHYLLTQVTVKHSDLRAMPKTAELRHQQNQSLPLHMKWMQECLWDGMIGQVSWTPVWVPVARIYEAYKTWVREHTNRFLDKLEFGRQASHFLTDKKATARRINGEVVRCVELRPLDEARRVFDERLKTRSEWPNGPGASVNPNIPF
jgi:hypothetical protein